MVLKQSLHHSHVCVLFENDVKMYGTQASKFFTLFLFSFENDVKMYGTQA